MERRVALFVGSLRAAAWSRKVARALIALAPHSLQPEIVEIGQLPLYNQDFDDSGNPPGSWTAFRQQVEAYEAVLFVTPEYNRSVPAPLKNAIDVGSRPYGKSARDGKSRAVVSVSLEIYDSFALAVLSAPRIPPAAEHHLPPRIRRRLLIHRGRHSGRQS